ncbi:MAG: cytochrome P450 [Hyphomicrobiales bacterium]
MGSFTPPTVAPPLKPLGIIGSLRAMRENALNIIPDIAYTQPIVTGKTGFSRWHMIQGPEALKHIFLDNVENYPKSEVVIRMLRPAVGESLFTSEGSNWRWQRRAISPVFTARNVTALAPLMTKTAERAATRIAKNQNGECEIVSEMLSATFDVICEVALSGREHFDSEKYAEAVTKYFLTVGRASLLDFLETPYWVPRPGEIRGRRAVKTMHKMVQEAIDARKKDIANQNEGSDDLIDYMMKAEDAQTGRKMAPKDLLHNMQFFIVAGHETTALTLAWALYLLANDQEAQEIARSEATSILGRGSQAKAASAEDIKKAPYIEQVLQETMRLYPPVGFLARKAVKADQLYDREIRAGDTMFLNIFSLHRHQDLWENPNVFNPNQFTKEKIEQRNKFQHLPFGAGPRICVGATFAMMQAQIILMTILSRFKFTPALPEPTPIMQMTIRPEPGVFLKSTHL